MPSGSLRRSAGERSSARTPSATQTDIGFIERRRTFFGRRSRDFFRKRAKRTSAQEPERTAFRDELKAVGCPLPHASCQIINIEGTFAIAASCAPDRPKSRTTFLEVSAGTVRSFFAPRVAPRFIPPRRPLPFAGGGQSFPSPSAVAIGLLPCDGVDRVVQRRLCSHRDVSKKATHRRLASLAAYALRVLRDIHFVLIKPKAFDLGISAAPFGDVDHPDALGVGRVRWIL